jgi:CheY-like chemotaxis protein
MAKILIVDDEKNIIKTLSAILQDENHIVYSSMTGEEALAFLRKKRRRPCHSRRMASGYRRHRDPRTDQENHS